MSGLVLDLDGLAGAGRARVQDEADVVIVGSGAGGATAARVLAEAGLDVIVVEEGPPVRPEELRRDVWSGLRRVWRDAGAQVAHGRAIIPMLQGVCVGGSTAINGAIIHRMPEPIFEVWRREHGFAFAWEDLARVWDTMDRELSVAPAPDEILGENNRLMGRGAAALGIASAAIRRNVIGCRGTARCLQGCPTSRRQSMDVTYVPRALAASARVYATCRAERVLVEGGRAAGVRARFAARGADGRLRRGPPLLARARRAVLLAAGAIHTPLLLAASGVRSPLVGARLQAHPGTAVLGVFDAPVRMGFGATQGWESMHFWPERFKMETIALPPELAAVRIPGFGAELSRALAEYDHLACWAVQVRARAHGRVRPGWGGARIGYDLADEDVRVLKRGVRTLCGMLFAAGAREVLPGVFGLPERVRSVDGLAALDALPDDPRLFHCIATHLFGTAAMGADPARSVVAPDGRCHALPGLYVADASVFPTNLGVNPQHTIAGVAWLVAEQIAGSAAPRYSLAT